MYFNLFLVISFIYHISLFHKILNLTIFFIKLNIVDIVKLKHLSQFGLEFEIALMHMN